MNILQPQFAVLDHFTTTFADVDCEWDDWANWAACSVTCDNGERTRNRAVKTEAIGDGTACPGSASETEPCTEQACSKLYRKIVRPPFYDHICST